MTREGVHDGIFSATPEVAPRSKVVWGRIPQASREVVERGIRPHDEDGAAGQRAKCLDVTQSRGLARGVDSHALHVREGGWRGISPWQALHGACGDRDHSKAEPHRRDAAPEH